MRAGFPCLAVALVIGGCHREDEATRLSGKDRKAEKAIDNAIAANSVAAVQHGLPVPQPTAVALKYDLPESFIGKWGMTKADCDPNRPNRRGLLEITPTKFKFFGSRGTVMAIDKRSQVDVTVRLSMEGDGKHWRTITELRLDAAGTQLERIERSPAGTYRYDRC